MTADARSDATEAVRDLVHALVAADADDATLERAAALAAPLHAALADAPRRARA